MPEFEKYNGTSCPKAHITMSCKRMTGYVNNDQLLIHCFQDSLVGAASKWYNQLSHTKIGSWRDLAQAFMKQYSHVTDMTPDRITLQNMEKKSGESFRQYAQRWREVAIQVQPPLLERETTMLFINTLKAPFITHMLGSATKSFSDIIMNGEMIENAIRNGKIEARESNKRPASRRKKNEGTEKPQFTSILMSYKELYQKLFNAHVVSPFYLSPLQPPYPNWYDTNAQCDYHARITGHSIENCTAFKKVVERLISIGVVKFDDSPNAKNLLPNHADKGVNMMSESRGEKVKNNIAEVKTPLKWVWREMAKRGLVISDSEKRYEDESYCEFHREVGHEIQECEGFKDLAQSMMDNKEMRFYEEVEDERNICVSELAMKTRETNHPVVIISCPRSNESRVQITPKIVIQKPSNFPHKDNKMVPWNYGCTVTILRKEVERNQEIGSYTRNGKRYDAQAESSREENWKKEQKKGKAVEVESLPALISTLALLLSSEAHRNALLKVLNETYVADDISVNKLDRLANNISVDNFIFFSDDEILSGGRGSTKALHVTARCKEYILPGVLIDNGSALSVLPLSTLSRLPVDNSHMKACQSIVKAFDGTEKRVIGRIEEGHGYTQPEQYLHRYTRRKQNSVPKISRTTEMGLRLMIGRGASPGKRLGKYLQGKIEAPMLKEKFDSYGLGYKPDMK
ncbi:uncharacterized protein LOC105761944 [Gossypium raimondii]|uniref:uncharacterized protein LOC105761944 n=1 Tax=Gossypium raimondii TaxID=29730 RepID=UPI00063AA109|nr:uncharacterized protein LOC105761944 [Gossypium raimondii]